MMGGPPAIRYLKYTNLASSRRIDIGDFAIEAHVPWKEEPCVHVQGRDPRILETLFTASLRVRDDRSREQGLRTVGTGTTAREMLTDCNAVVH